MHGTTIFLLLLLLLSAKHALQGLVMTSTRPGRQGVYMYKVVQGYACKFNRQNWCRLVR